MSGTYGPDPSLSEWGNQTGVLSNTDPWNFSSGTSSATPNWDPNANNVNWNQAIGAFNQFGKGVQQQSGQQQLVSPRQQQSASQMGQGRGAEGLIALMQLMQSLRSPSQQTSVTGINTGRNNLLGI